MCCGGAGAAVLGRSRRFIDILLTATALEGLIHETGRPATMASQFSSLACRCPPRHRIHHPILLRGRLFVPSLNIAHHLPSSPALGDAAAAHHHLCSASLFAVPCLSQVCTVCVECSSNAAFELAPHFFHIQSMTLCVCKGNDFLVSIGNCAFTIDVTMCLTVRVTAESCVADRRSTSTGWSEAIVCKRYSRLLS